VGPRLPLLLLLSLVGINIAKNGAGQQRLCYALSLILATSASSVGLPPNGTAPSSPGYYTSTND
jgi:hypothetical protein